MTTKLVITVEGDSSDIDFIRARCVGAVEEMVAEYEQNFDGEVEVGWELDR